MGCSAGTSPGSNDARPWVIPANLLGQTDHEQFAGNDDVLGRELGVRPRLLAKALTIRRTEERLLKLFAEGRVSGTVHTCIGQEWVGVAVADTLKEGDFVFSNHRCHGHYLAWTNDVEGLIAEIMGRSTGVCGGRGGSQHLCKDGFFSNGIQGGIAPVAAGLAMARRLDGGSNIAVVFIGDGTLGQGVVYETMNIAAKWHLPLLIVLEDNGVSQSTLQDETLSGSIKGRAHAFGIDVRSADTWNPSELIDVTAAAVSHVRRTRHPVLLHIRTYRLKAHSKGDDNREIEEVQAYAEIDTLSRLLDEPSDPIRNLIEKIDRRLDEAVDLAEQASPTEPVVLLDHAPAGTEPVEWRSLDFRPQRVVDAIRTALDESMAEDDRIVLMGEDVCDPYGGAFKVTAGLSSKYDDRVRNTPISEAAVVGIGSGLAIAGFKPVVEIMFGDFVMLAADQIINHAAKFAEMYNAQVRVPIIIRTPMGGYRGYGPTHSQSLEKHLLGVPGTRVLAVHTRYCPGTLYRRLLQTIDRPTLVIENKLLYGRRADPQAPAGSVISATATDFPTIRISPESEPSLTVVAYGGLVPMAETAVESLIDEDIACDMLIPTQLYPLDIEPIVESVARTGRILVIEEGQGFAGFGSELIAKLAEDRRIPSLRARRVHAWPCAIPASSTAESTILPSVESILKAVFQLVLG
ncbi:MAG TPA: thiamine pyrophosphate-dependent enzyme [Phycisphaerae bacterium]|nr:thiamine pyrophosphate-dependent enzyme [Phycisphaerae bacterium]HRR83708.1 thiamine pyrophosphate-dependent enzyme [Phycisphaerae bacterium]